METERQRDNPVRLSAVRRDLDTLNDKIDIVNTKVETLNLRVKPVSENSDIMYNTTDTRTRQLQEIEKRNDIHSAQLRYLQKEIEYVQTENDLMLEHMRNKESPRGYLSQNQPGDAFNDKFQDERKFNNSRASEKMQPIQNEGGFDKGWVATTPDKKQGTPVPRPEDDFKRTVVSAEKREDGQDNRRKEVQDNYRQPNSRARSKDFDYEDYQKQRQAQVYSCYDTTAINPHLWEQKPKHKKYPWFDHETHPYPGGLMIMRFDDSGYEVVNDALKRQQSICRHAGGYLMGISRKERIYVFENAPSKLQNWLVSRKQPYKDCLMTENALAVFWFTKMEASETYFENCHHNRFREPCFPTPNGYEAFYVPLQEAPTRQLNTFFCIEFLDAARLYDPGNMTQFEGEVREDMLRFHPNCCPMVVSSQTGRVIFKPGPLISPHSKLYISRFESQREVDSLWKSGMINALRKKWKLTGAINVYSYTIDIAV